MPENETINIRPGVTILSVLRHLNYKPWYAMAEFVDNSLQSFLDYHESLAALVPATIQLRIAIELADDSRQITIRDNAAGIHTADYGRAFRPAAVPPDQSGLGEFGMGLKSAACWFAPKWRVRTSALGEPIQRTIAFDIDRIVRDEVEELDVQIASAPREAHFTEVTLVDVYTPPRGRTVGKIKEHLASIYRIFVRRGQLSLTFDGNPLTWSDPAVLEAPHYQDLDGPRVSWTKSIDMDFGMDQRVHGFAALRKVGSTTDAGFALFRRDRVIEGSADDGYRPHSIFGASNSFTYQRLFGELHLDGFGVSHTKDGFRWEEHEDIVLEHLKQQLNEPPIPLLSQAENYRSREVRIADVRPVTETAVQSTGNVLEQRAQPAIEAQLDDPPVAAPTPEDLPTAELASHRTVSLVVDGQPWEIALELSIDPAVGDWLYIADRPTEAVGSTPRRLSIRIALAHPFTQRFAGPSYIFVEPLLRLGVALALAEVVAREAGVAFPGEIRRRVNALLRDPLAQGPDHGYPQSEDQKT